MKDIHNERASPGRIPILSPIIHCIAMTGLVYLRSSFGFVFLRPKSVFFAFSWAFGIFAYIAYHEPDLWKKYRIFCSFGAGAVALYWLHLAQALFREISRKGEHDHYSGKSHISRIQSEGHAIEERDVHLWYEPALIFLCSLILYFLIGEDRLSAWLLIVSISMLLKEFTNYWSEVRRDKIKHDMFGDAAEQGESLPAGHVPAQMPTASRREGVRQGRKKATPAADDVEQRFALLLGLDFPYSLPEAEERYRSLMKAGHPDVASQSSESNARAAELNEAIAFFRKRLPIP